MLSFPEARLAARPLARACTLLAAVALSPCALAAQYSLTPKVQQQFKYDSNFRLIADSKDVFSYELAPSLNLVRETERLILDFEAEASFDRFSEEEFDSDNQRVELSADWKGIKSAFNVAAGFARDSTLSSENINEPDDPIDEPDDIEFFGGLLPEAFRRELAHFNTAWRRVLSQRLSFSVSGRYQDATYEAPFFNDFQYGLLQFVLSQSLTERTSVDYTVYGSWFGTEPSFFSDEISLSNATTTYAAQVGVSRFFTESLRGFVRVGYREAELRTDVVKPVPDPNFCQFFNICFELRESRSQSGMIGSLGISYLTEGNEFSAKIDVADRPSAQGLLEAQSLVLSWRRQLAERLSLAVEARAEQSEVIRGTAGTALGIFSREYVRIAPRLRWRFSENWAVAAGVQFRTQQADAPRAGGVVERSNESFAVVMSLDYLPGRKFLN